MKEYVASNKDNFLRYLLSHFAYPAKIKQLRFLLSNYIPDKNSVQILKKGGGFFNLHLRKVKKK